MSPTTQPPRATPPTASHRWGRLEAIASMGRALRHRNYRLFFFGQGISLVGTWLTRIATSWLVYRLTGSAMLLGVVGFASQIPTFLLAPLAALVDDDKRGRVMSFYAMAFFGTAPLGSLFAGFLASHVGAPLTILIGGASCVVGGLIFARVLPELREIARPIYQRLGILPTDGESATHVDG